MHQSRGIPGQGSRRGLIRGQLEGRGLMALSVKGDPEKRKSFEI